MSYYGSFARERDPRPLFAAIVRAFNAVQDSRGWWHAVCPVCGKGNRHFAMHIERGAKCMHCGETFSLRRLAELANVPPDARPEPLPEAKPVRVRPWQRRADQLVRDLAATPGALKAWRDYKPVNEDSIARHGLGYGVWPGGLPFKRGDEWIHCHHPRLIVPLYTGGQVTGFRCRAVTCDCKKWLSPGGTVLTLFNADRLPRPRMVSSVEVRLAQLDIVENPIDAILIEQEWSTGLDFRAVATLGVSIWNEDYTAAVAGARPKLVNIWFDHDAAGHKAANKLRTRLRSELAGLEIDVEIYEWSAKDPKDVGEFFK